MGKHQERAYHIETDVLKEFLDEASCSQPKAEMDEQIGDLGVEAGVLEGVREALFQSASKRRQSRDLQQERLSHEKSLLRAFGRHRAAQLDDQSQGFLANQGQAKFRVFGHVRLH